MIIPKIPPIKARNRTITEKLTKGENLLTNAAFVSRFSLFLHVI